MKMTELCQNRLHLWGSEALRSTKTGKFEFLHYLLIAQKDSEKPRQTFSEFVVYTHSHLMTQSISPSVSELICQSIT
jgi:hypothetical protein